MGLSLGWWTSLSFRAQTKPEPRPGWFFSWVDPNFPKNILVSFTWESQGIGCVLPTRETARRQRGRMQYLSNLGKLEPLSYQEHMNLTVGRNRIF